MSSPPAAAPPAELEQPAADMIEAVVSEGLEALEVDDADSTLGNGEADSTVSITSSIRQYSKFRGRSYHSQQHGTCYCLPIDDKVLDNFDLIHHYLTLLLDGKIFLAPIPEDVQNVLDVGTGTGIWAIDFADDHPGARVTGTDLSPVQPLWVPPNLRFEIEDCTRTWSRDDNIFDYVHIRYLIGGIKDWTALFKEAYRVLQPGGFLESVESQPTFYSDDETITDETVLGSTFEKLFMEGGEATGASLRVMSDRLQVKAMQEAGFVDIQEVVYKIPIGSWPRDPRLAHIGRCARLSLDSDLDGYTQMLWHQVLEWPEKEYEIFLMQVRDELRDPNLHPYVKIRYAWGRKPEEKPA